MVPPARKNRRRIRPSTTTSSPVSRSQIHAGGSNTATGTDTRRGVEARRHLELRQRLAGLEHAHLGRARATPAHDRDVHAGRNECRVGVVGLLLGRRLRCGLGRGLGRHRLLPTWCACTHALGHHTGEAVTCTKRYARGETSTLRRARRGVRRRPRMRGHACGPARRAHGRGACRPPARAGRPARTRGEGDGRAHGARRARVVRGW